MVQILKLEGIQLQLSAMWHFLILYATYQIVLVSGLLLARRFWGLRISPWMLSFVQAVSLIVGVMWLMMYVLVGPSLVAKYYETRLFANSSVTKYIVRICDVLVHFLPVILLGTTTSVISYIFGGLTMLFWYLVTRPFLTHLLSTMPVRVSDIVMYVAYPICVAMLYIIRAL